MVASEQKSSPCYKICIRGWEEFLCFLIEFFKINLLLKTPNIKTIEFISEQPWNVLSLTKEGNNGKKISKVDNISMLCQKTSILRRYGGAQPNPEGICEVQYKISEKYDKKLKYFLLKI
ncbi:hypothetical protein BpHYR1_052324 [Brachionus plicatilis]|uniref:Uncharacterized protein n=1 Tax=Brachionus plicatilis TaxID=10195 RepID=A0A3M7T3L9_BRAPC|nr:hypothetical protein BpHYR1_052324 [Brachionus plicatilis]